MEMKVDEQDGVQVFALCGKIMGGPEDAQLGAKLGDLLDQSKVHVVFDLSGVTWMNSRGLGMCLEWMTRLRNRGGDLRLVGLQPAVHSLMERCRILPMFQSYEDVNAAVKSF